ncbi:hypothetical protein Cmtc_08580 [Cupriavidus sp. TKC]|uniref:hypothetical protein n=1 Tax=Cupriavidus sp. TKC TaxID=2880159 RepID=UPI0025A7FCB7|nr:hypothetical protein [Cupriavidus sp. TKC]GMG89638.1 hypothetical protein Cmtc_08580 [Cupriavidus sp. TKC]
MHTTSQTQQSSAPTRIYLITHSDGCWLKAEYTVDQAEATRLARADFGDDVIVEPVPDTDAAARKLASRNSASPDYWHDLMPEEVARRVLGSGHFDFAVAQGPAFCATRAAGAWQANLPESFGAYHAAKKIAEQRKHVALHTFDSVTADPSRDSRQRAAEVRYSARKAL